MLNEISFDIWKCGTIYASKIVYVDWPLDECELEKKQICMFVELKCLILISLKSVKYKLISN